MMEKMMNKICAALFVVGLVSFGFIGFLFLDLLFAILPLFSVLAEFLNQIVVPVKIYIPMFVRHPVILTVKDACQRRLSLPFPVLPGSRAS